MNLPRQIQDYINFRITRHEGTLSPVDTVFLLRGLPGSGKSTFAMKLFGYCQNTATSLSICSADEWFTFGGGYAFDGDALHRAHAHAEGQFLRAMALMQEVIVIDNCNLQHRDFEFYVDHARRHDYDVVAVQWRPRNEVEADEVVRQSVHLTHGNGRQLLRRYQDLANGERNVSYVFDLPIVIDRVQTFDGRGYRVRDGDVETRVDRINHFGRGYELRYLQRRIPPRR